MTESKPREMSGTRPFVKTHGLSRSPEYKCWLDMIQRCQNKKNRAYHNYGARGITVSEHWGSSFSNFIKDMGTRPSQKHSLDRIDNNKGYFKENCRWSLRSEQQRNQRPRHNKKYKGTYYVKKLKKYVARIWVDGRCIYIGSYSTEKDAGTAYKLKYESFYGK